MGSREQLNFDIILQEVGEFGRYQIFVVLLLLIPACFMNSFNSFGAVFVYYTPDHFCNPPDYHLHFLNDSNYHCELMQCSYSISRRIEADSESGTNKTHLVPLIQNATNCNSYTYGDNIFDHSAIDKWNLVCERGFYKSLLISVGTAFGIVGCGILGYLGDRLGRKPCLFITIALYCLGTIPSAFVDNFIGFTVLRMISNFTLITAWNISYLYALEFVGVGRRTIVSTIFCIGYAVGSMSLAAIVYLSKSFQIFLLVTSIPFVGLIFAYPILEESPRWLLSQGRLQHCKRVVRKILLWENARVSNAELDRLLGVRVKFLIDRSEPPLLIQRGFELMSLLKAKTLRKLMIVITAVWTVNAVAYYAIAYNVENLGGNFFVTYVVQASVEIPAVILNLFLLNRQGRIWPLFISMVLAGICALLTALGRWLITPVIIALAVMTKFGICMSYAIIYQLASELYPTEVRGLTLGLSTIIADIGNLAMPYIVESSGIYRALPMVILGVFCILGGVSVLVLPDTKDRIMPETVEQVEKLFPVGKEALAENMDCCKCCKRRGGLDVVELQRHHQFVLD